MEAPLNPKAHWETIYQQKGTQEVSWYQAIPKPSLQLIAQTGISKDATLIDIGGGESRLSLYLQEAGYQHISVLDISAKALEKARESMGPAAANLTWICTDILDFRPENAYDLWHDRAAFHFLTTEPDRQRYIATATKAINPGGYLVLGTFSPQGPAKCSGIPVQRYSATALNDLWETGFDLVHHEYGDHQTPFDTTQHFTFCIFKRKA